MALVILVEGLISAGKSTLIEKCLVPMLNEMGLKVKVVKEPVDQWVKSGILQNFYNDPVRWGYTFQTAVFQDRILEAVRSKKEDDDVDIYIMERSPYSDSIFMETLYETKCVTELEYQMYQTWWAMWHEFFPFQPDMVLYLQTKPEECMKRLAIRNRHGESKVTLDYQNLLYKKHEEMFQKSPVTMGPYSVQSKIIDGNSQFEKDPELMAPLIVEISELFYQKLNKPS